ncbi:PilW family protein [Pelagibaculum spongiae]|uniref:Pilus assembly protein PilW n=1 Tax=Pelagibaculum spongiae TaxID=2080658 RepID=A0A2V1H488_9GAMM|nr:PilW family protein [Pelagibaculum spongiae]PVZ70446.1 hypothetical protein DC094_07615 [Pelagibaculum spongiae]
MKLNSFKQIQSGLTLVELLIAVTLSLLLLAGAGQIFFGANPTYRKSNEEIRLQDSGRFSVEAISRDVRLAGYQGCADPNLIEPNRMSNVADTVNPFDEAVRAFRVDSTGDWSPSRPTDLNSLVSANAPRNNSDVISIQRASARFSQLAIDMVSATGVVTLANNNLGLVANDIVIISDCETVDIFEIGSVTVTTAPQVEVTFTTNSATPDRNNFSKIYTNNARVMQLISRTYYTKNNGKTNRSGYAGYSLYQHESGDTSELSEGVEFLRVGLSERIAGGGLKVLTDDLSSADLGNVVGVQIAMLVQTAERSRNRQDGNSYDLLGSSFSPTDYQSEDLRSRRIFQTVLSIRNRENRG